ncbi:unnamed protein product [Rhizoctonia solani]|uniref:Lysosomal dipeptide transporter MFSD1 n=1 Tax=Rhizoctonia solani TaxID=456999 RepID=A0A8H2W749_9AGAM|nr:unnamed protein product [Rhizoctonia solani]
MSEKVDISNELPYTGLPAASREGGGDDKFEPSPQDRALEVDPTEGAPWRWRIIAMIFALSLAVGSSFSEATLGPLKSTLVKDLHISNAQYGTISSATSVVNMCLPIIGGYLVDFYPIEYGMLFCAFSVFAGAIVSAVGAQHDAFGPVIGGRLLMGFGSTIIEIIPQKIYCHWFRGRGLAFVLGLDVSWGKVVVLIAKATAVPMSKVGGEWAWALWIPAMVCGANIVLTFGYMVWIRTLPQEVRMCSVQQVIPIFLSPFLGAFFDRYGHRMLFISITSCIWIMVFAVLGFSAVNALFPMVFSSVALAFNAMPFVCSVPILVASQDQIGTGYGLYKAFNNAGSVIVDVAAGAIQDKTPGDGYNGVIAFFIALKSMEIFWGSVYGVLDRRLLRGVLSMSEKERLEMEKKIDLNIQPGRQPVKAWTYGGWVFLGASVAIALVLFIKYSI